MNSWRKQEEEKSACYTNVSLYFISVLSALLTWILLPLRSIFFFRNSWLFFSPRYHQHFHSVRETEYRVDARLYLLYVGIDSTRDSCMRIFYHKVEINCCYTAVKRRLGNGISNSYPIRIDPFTSKMGCTTYNSIFFFFSGFMLFGFNL